MSKTILAVGAAGKFGGLVVPALADRGATVRGFVHDARDGNAVRAQDASDYIAPVALPDEAETGMAFVAAAIHAGVQRFVAGERAHPACDTRPRAAHATRLFRGARRREPLTW